MSQDIKVPTTVTNPFDSEQLLFNIDSLLKKPRIHHEDFITATELQYSIKENTLMEQISYISSKYEFWRKTLINCAHKGEVIEETFLRTYNEFSRKHNLLKNLKLI